MTTPRLSSVGLVERLGGRVGRWCRSFIGVVAHKRTYANLVYLSLAFPLGVGYLLLFITGAGVPLSLVPVFADIASAGVVELLIVGIPVVLLFVTLALPMLALLLVVSIELAALERWLATRLLAVDISTGKPVSTFRDGAHRLVTDRGTWTGLTYLASKVVLGTITFVILVFGFTFTYALVTSPLHYDNDLVGIHIDVDEPLEIVPGLSYSHDGWTIDLVASTTLQIANGELISTYVDSLPAALAVAAVGVVVGLVLVHLCNAMAWLYAYYTRYLLSATQPSIVRRLLDE